MKCDKDIGMDMHQAMTVVVVLDADVKLVLETIVQTEAASTGSCRVGAGRCGVTFEEGTQAACVSRG